MVSKEQIDREIRDLPSEQLRGINTEKIARNLNYWSDKFGLRLTFYGLLRWAVEKYGSKALFASIIASESVARGYAEAALHYRDDMPAAVVNAGQYLNALSGQIGDVDICIRQLERMSFPYVIYVLFAGVGQAELVGRFKEQAEEHMKRYPSTLDKLPERYRTVRISDKEEGEDADIG